MQIRAPYFSFALSLFAKCPWRVFKGPRPSLRHRYLLSSCDATWTRSVTHSRRLNSRSTRGPASPPSRPARWPAVSRRGGAARPRCSGGSTRCGGLRNQRWSSAAAWQSSGLRPPPRVRDSADSAAATSPRPHAA